MPVDLSNEAPADEVPLTAFTQEGPDVLLEVRGLCTANVLNTRQKYFATILTEMLDACTIRKLAVAYPWDFSIF